MFSDLANQDGWGIHQPLDLPNLSCIQLRFASTGRLIQVEVVDISIPFGSMVAFMVKWALASIPAFTILIYIYVVLATFLLPAIGIHMPTMPSNY